MDHAAGWMIQSAEVDPELGAIRLLLKDLRFRLLVGVDQRAMLAAVGTKPRRVAVIRRRFISIGVPDFQPAPAQLLKRLRRRDLVRQVQIDIQDRRRARFLQNNMRVPDLIK